MLAIPNSVIQKIYDLDKSVRGTSDYTRYRMEMYTKICGKWVFIGFHVPITTLDGELKNFRGTYYLYNGRDRYTCNKLVLDFILKEVQHNR